MSIEIKEWRERTKPQRRAQLKARHSALRDLKGLGIVFDFLRPCETSLNRRTLKGSAYFRRSRTTFNLLTDSVMSMYVMSLGGGRSIRVVELRTGHFYYLRTHKNKAAL